MKMDCDVIRDLLPLYADDACSGRSRELVEEHLQACPSCSDMLERLRATEIENDLHREKETVIEYGIRQFRRRSAAVGSAVSAVITIPILIGLAVAAFSGMTQDWFYIVLASMCVAASVIAVPIMVPEDKLFWTFCAFTASLMVLLGVICLYVRGAWFWVASSATLFGLAVAFMPALIRARPVRKLIGDSSKPLIVLGTDAALFINMMNMIRSNGRFTLSTLLFTLLILAGVGLVVAGIMRKRENKK